MQPTPAFVLTLIGYSLAIACESYALIAVTEPALAIPQNNAVVRAAVDHEESCVWDEPETPQFIYPTQGVLTSLFGWRWGRMHRGIDIAGPVGTPIVAAAAGQVRFAGWNAGGYGYLVELEHGDGSSTRYAHCSEILVSVGQTVEQGEAIALMGSTGYSTGPHLHFELHPAGQGAVNPLAFLLHQ